MTLYFRRAVPLDVRDRFGRAEVWVSLGTANVHEARGRLAEQLASFDKAVRAAREANEAAPTACAPILPTREAVDAAVRSWLLKRIERDQEADFGGLEGAEGYARDAGLHATAVERGIGSRAPQLSTAWITSQLVEQEGWAVEPGSSAWFHISRRVAAAEIERSRRVASELGLHTVRQPDPAFAPDRYTADAARLPRQGSSVPLLTLFEAYAREAKIKPASVKSSTQCLGHLITFLGHSDASRVTADDILRWKERLQTQPRVNGGEPRDPRTIRDKYLATARTLFRWAVSNRKVASDPTAGITVIVPKKPLLRDKGLTDDEARIVLSAASAQPHDAKARSQGFARRWVPWLCAYTGARVGEITQMRGEDVLSVAGIACIRITPEAGSQKSNQARVVPLHPHLVEMGFLAAVGGSAGPLFFDPSRHRGGSLANPQSKKVAERMGKWVRELGVSDPSVQPNHGWRHRFKTEARRVRMDPEIRDAIQGHAFTGEGQKYGHVPPEAMMVELRLLPAYIVK